jgi:hypothetical protein
MKNYLETNPSANEIVDGAVVFLVTIIAIFILGTLTTLWGSWVFETVWTWYLVPAGVPAISQFTAVGIIIIATSLTMGLAAILRNLDKSPNSFANIFAIAFGWAIVLFTAWFYKFVVFGFIL